MARCVAGAGSCGGHGAPPVQRRGAAGSAASVEREVAQPRGFGTTDAVLDTGALTVAQLKDSKVRIGLVGHRDLEAVPVVVGEAQLRAGVGVLAAAQHVGAGRPVAQGDPAGQLADLRAVAGLTVTVYRAGPGVLRLGA
jgi:hypothetical protein